MQTQAELYFRYGEPKGERAFEFTEDLEYQVSVEVFEDGTAVIVDWASEPNPTQIIDRMNTHLIDFLYPGEKQ